MERLERLERYLLDFHPSLSETWMKTRQYFD